MGQEMFLRETDSRRDLRRVRHSGSLESEQEQESRP